jgi:hypothetical protein
MQLRSWGGFGPVVALVIATLLLYTAHPFGGNAEAQPSPPTDVQTLAGAVGMLAGEIHAMNQRLDEHDMLTKQEIISRQQLAEAVDRLTAQEARDRR